MQKELKENEIQEEQINIEQQEQTTQIVDNKPTELTTDQLADNKKQPNLNGKTRTITKIKLLQNPVTKKTDKGKPYLNVLMKLIYEDETHTNLSGMKRYIDETKQISSITFWKEGNNAVANLFKQYVKFTGKDANEISPKLFVEGLIGMKVKLKHVLKKFGGKEYAKNEVESFIK